MKAVQFVHTLNYGDAISGEAIAIKRLLEERGSEAKIFALHAHEKVEHLTERWSSSPSQLAELEQLGRNDLVLNHYSIASPLNDVFGELTKTHRALLYHNLTPPEWYADYNPRVHSALIQGKRELPALLAVSDIVLADSEFNRGELEALGCRDVRVLPLLLDRQKWTAAANPGIARILSGHGGVNVLHVGRLAPNKCVEDIIRAFYFYHHKIERRSKLWLVGIDVDTELYSFELRRLISKLQLREAVTFVGSVADTELRAFYENSQVYICMSEHEGFCLPLLEAMYFKLPVIAFDACAVAGTLGEAGVLVRKKEPAIIAELINILASDASVRHELAARGSDRAALFFEEHFVSTFDRILMKNGAAAAGEPGDRTGNGSGRARAQSWA